MEQHFLRSFEAQCTQEEPPACQTMCPLHVEARTFAGLMAGGKLADARKVLDRTMPLPGLVGFLCDGPCLPHCRRAEVDGGVNMPLLERACVRLTQASRVIALPATGKRVAVAGAGLSSLAAAWELGKKGHLVTLYHSGPVGGRLLALAAAALPEDAIEQALAQLAAVRVVLAPLPAFSEEWLPALLPDVSALYLGLDDPSVRACPAWAAHGLAAASGRVAFAPLTLATADPKIFAGAAPGEGGASFVLEAADGKRAAASIIRLMQGVDPGTAREHEAVYPSLLFTDISGVQAAPPVLPADPAAPSREEGAAEAARCIQCQCLECVKRCVYLERYKGYPKRYAREMYNNLSVVHGLRRTNTQINSCAQCGLCAAVCPQHADMGAFCAAARKEMVHSKRMPPSAHEFALEDMAFSTAGDVAFFRHQPGKERSAWAFFPGCQLPASLPEQSRQVYEHLAAALEGGVGMFFQCCGAPARWSGRDGLPRDHADAVQKHWEAAGRPTLIVACASCAAFFAAELPDMPTLSLWDVLADLPPPPGAAGFGEPLALHDPCAARGTPATRQSVRALARTLGQAVEELDLGRDMTRCCGYGGLAAAADPAMGTAYAQSRADDSALPLLTYCIMCRDRLRAVGAPTVHLLDLLFPGQRGKDAAQRPAPGISARQENRLAFRRRMLHDLWNEPPARNSRMESMIVHIDDALARKLEARRILHSDIKAVLMHAEDEGAQFVNRDSNRMLTSLRPKQVTFWVEYRQEPGGAYTVFDAYCHRMVVPGTPGDGLPTAAVAEGGAPKGGRM